MKCLLLTKNKHMEALVLRNLAELKVSKRAYKQALSYASRSLSLYQAIGEREGAADAYYQIAVVYEGDNNPDSAILYADKSLSLAKEIGFKRNIHNTYEVLAKAYAAKQYYKQAYRNSLLYSAYKDSLTGEEKLQEVAALKFRYELDKKQSQIELLTKDRLLREEEAKHQRQKIYVLLAGFVLVGLLALVFIRANLQKKKANKLLEKQKTEVQNTLKELKETQVQLVQREKMASLGELTAGIAHEIQNPLNFVNNFSEVNKELINELKEEIAKGNFNEVKIIADGIAENEQKIIHHGQRADAIVKGMLQHSRANTGTKEPTNINALADEYVRLSYHGLRAKDKNFNATIKTDFDPTIGQINIVPQDIGRVLLNLYNNAFYATKEKAKKSVEEYEPLVTVTTKRTSLNMFDANSSSSLAEGLVISVKDNGNGIPTALVDKIFQPFFTTKPTGQGTGLGLSLSYDIIKAHGGEMKVESKEGEGSEFVIMLPA
jgi:signal transduction histidine kinase